MVDKLRPGSFWEELWANSAAIKGHRDIPLGSNADIRISLDNVRFRPTADIIMLLFLVRPSLIKGKIPLADAGQPHINNVADLPAVRGKLARRRHQRLPTEPLSERSVIARKASRRVCVAHPRSEYRSTKSSDEAIETVRAFNQYLGHAYLSGSCEKP